MRLIISEHGSASYKLTHSHIPIHTASKRNISLLILVVIHTLICCVCSICIVFVTAFSRWAVLSLLNVHSDASTVWWLVILLLHPSAQSFIRLYGRLRCRHPGILVLIFFEKRLAVVHRLAWHLVCALRIILLFRLVMCRLHLLRHVLFDVYVFTLDHWYQNCVSLPKFN